MDDGENGMKAEDLRIGNWYDSGNFGDYHQMTGKDIWEFEQDPIDDIYYPIPLTEEWLLKIPNNIIAKLPEWIKNVHEFQNWYYWNNNKKEFDFNDKMVNLV